MLDALACSFLGMLRHVGIQADLAVPFGRRLLRDDIYHASCGAVAIARRSRAADNFDAFDLFRRYPVTVATRVAFSAPSVADRRAVVDLACRRSGSACFPAPCRAGRSAGCCHADRSSNCQFAVHAGHGPDDFRYIVGGRLFGDVLGRDYRNAWCLFQGLFPPCPARRCRRVSFPPRCPNRKPCRR